MSSSRWWLRTHRLNICGRDYLFGKITEEIAETVNVVVCQSVCQQVDVIVDVVFLQLNVT